jgi:hypothetical protein
MRRTKLSAVVASLAVTSGMAAVLAAAPAQADTPTQTSLNVGGRTGVTALYGSYIGTITAQVTDGSSPATIGSADLQQRLPGKGWKVVKTDHNAADGVTFGRYGSKAKSNVKYRVHYLGGTDPVSTAVYAPSFSNTVIVKTAWGLAPHAVCGTHCRFFGKLSPKSKHHKILIQVKHHGWKRYKVLHTDKRSHWTVSVKPSRGGGTYYRAVVAKTKTLIRDYAIGHFTIVGKSSYAISSR